MDIRDFKISGDLGLEMKGELFLLSLCADLASIRTIICGHSHSLALAHSIVFNHELNHQTLHLGRRYGLAGLRGGPYSPAYQAAMDALAEEKNIAVVWDGNQIARRFLLSAAPGIDLIPRDYSDTSVLPGAEIVPEEAVRAQLLVSLRPLIEFLGRERRDPALKRYIIGTHPPIEDGDDIRRRLAHEPVLTEQAAALGLSLDRVAVTPGSVRRKLWFVLQRLMEELAEEAGALFVPAVADAFDARGYLNRKYEGHDITHANLFFGQAMIEQLTRYLDVP